MKALRLEEPRQWRFDDIPEPGEPGPGEALVRVHRVGVCGTDISGYLGKMPFFSYPRIPGHELGVEVLAVGEGVTDVRPGDACAVEPYVNCGECFACRRGAPNCCLNLRVLGVHADGGLRPRFLLPARKLHPAAGLDWEQMALVETLAIGCHAVDRGAPKADDTVLVVGAGPIGLAAIEFLRLTPARLIVMDLNETRLAFCRERLGIAETVAAGPGGLAELERLTGGDLATLVIDATGAAPAMEASFRFVGHTGRMVFVGIVPDDIRFADPLFHRREMTLLASRNALPADFARIIGLIRAGTIDTRPWVSRRLAFADVPGEFPSLIGPEAGVVKAIIDVGE